MTDKWMHRDRALKIGQEAIDANRWADAESAFKVALREDPMDPVAYAGLGDALLGQKQLEKALDCYKLAGRFSHGDPVYLREIADVQERLGRLHDASVTYLSAGESSFRQGRLDEATVFWQRAVRIMPDLLGAHYRLAIAYQGQGAVKAAVREYLAIARILKMRGKEQQALQLCRVAQRLDPNNRDVEMAMLLISGGAAEVEAEGSTRSAAEYSTPAKRSGDSQPPIDTEEGFRDPLLSVRREAQDQLAAEIFRDEDDDLLSSGTGVPSLSKMERDALIGQGLDYQHRGRLQEAILCYEKAVAGGLTLPAAHFTLGTLYMDLQQPDRARRALMRAASDASLLASIEMALARLHLSEN